MAPMSEFMKPSSIGIANEMINTEMHLNGARYQDYYKTEKFFFDYSIAYDFEDKSLLENMTNDQFLNLKGRFKRNIYQKN